MPDAEMPDPDQTELLRPLKWPLRLTHGGLLAEQIVRAFWPLWTALLVVWAVLAFGLHETVTGRSLWIGAVVALVAVVLTSAFAVRTFKLPTRGDAMARLDMSMPGRPITAALDTQAIGAGDVASKQVWEAHKRRMEARLSQAEAVQPDLRLSQSDPFALRYVALLFFAMAIGFGSIWRADTLGNLAPGTAGEALAAGPAWEVWIEPPAYTGKPSLYLNDVNVAELSVPKDSQLTVRLYGEVGTLRLVESVSGQPLPAAAADQPPQTAFSVPIVQSGDIRIEGAEDAAWTITTDQDAAPVVVVTAEVERTPDGEMRLPFDASDDYGVERGQAEITLNLAAADRRYGLTPEPEPRETIVVDLPMPISGERTEFTELLIENLAQHPWATLPVTITFEVEDAAAQASAPFVLETDLPGRRFFQPIAKGVIEQRRDILWSRDNAPRISQVLRTITHRPDDFFPNETAYMTLRMAITRLEIANEFGLSEEKRDEIAEMLWSAAVLLEEGSLSDALERLRRAQEKLSDAMRDGASDEEIAELMQELSEAMQDYMRQLAEQQDPNDQQQQQQAENSETITDDQLQEMLDEIQRLMEEGRMDEAEQLLSELMEMMQNMQVARGQPGEGQQSPGEQAMEGLQDTLRQQQGLSDEAFRDLQEQFNPDAQAGESEGNEGRNGGQGRGQSHEGDGGQGQADNQGQGEGQQGQQQGQNGQGGEDPGSLADRQQALRGELDRQSRNLPGAGTPEGDAARDALDRAGEAMDRAEDALRDDQTAEALGAQSDAMEALREGMRNLGDAMASQQQPGGPQGQANGRPGQRSQDPLGREAGSDGVIGSEDNMLQSEDARRRSRELLDEIRRRSGDQERPEIERDYLRRLLDRF